MNSREDNFANEVPINLEQDLQRSMRSPMVRLEAEPPPKRIELREECCPRCPAEQREILTEDFLAWVD